MIEQALVYATCARGLLVFKEPDFSDVPMQVPGGTVEEGEPVIHARREFGEETGLIDRTGFRLLGDSHRAFKRDGQLHNLHRTYSHLPLEDSLPDTWDHFETTPSGGVWRKMLASRADVGHRSLRHNGTHLWKRSLLEPRLPGVAWEHRP